MRSPRVETIALSIAQKLRVLVSVQETLLLHNEGNSLVHGDKKSRAEYVLLP